MDSFVLTSIQVCITFNPQLSNIDASCVEPGHLATMLVNLFKKTHEYIQQNILYLPYLLMTYNHLILHKLNSCWNSILHLK